MEVRAGGETITIHDVLVGDVWVASGQSNMEFPLVNSANGPAEAAAAHDSLLRQFKVPNSWATSPQDDLAGGEWTSADPRHAGQFSAVAYYFARELRRTTRVPIAVLNTTWSGSNIETWLSRAALRLGDSAVRAIALAQDARVDSLRTTLRAKLGTLPTVDSGLAGGRAPWAAPTLDDASWAPMRVPSYWESNGYAGMDGVAWYRTTVDFGATVPGGDATLTAAGIDDDDVIWINGTEVGRTNGYAIKRSYRVPAGLLHPGANTIAVRVADWGGGGGINGEIALTFADGTRRSLAGDWKFKVGAVSFQPDGQVINKVPTVLYNRMVHPILPIAIAGVIWYQGESNSNNAEQGAAYRAQFKTLIESWRREWNGGKRTFPFLWVQLPGYGPSDVQPVARPAWALQRESMEAALSLPRTGRAIAIDVGDSADLHPANKKDPGERLARVARVVAYGQKVAATGPTYRSHVVKGDTIVVTFDHAEGLATLPAGAAVKTFAIAGADHRFVWADARVEGGRVKVWSRDVKKPVAVRYAWANDPIGANLYNGEGLPAAPFRTDRW